MPLVGVIVYSVFSSAAAEGDFDHTHALYGHVLRTYVMDGLVDYAALKASPGDLNRYLDGLAVVSELEFRSWTGEERLSYLINLYNAQTLKLIIDHYPLKSIKDIGNVLKGPWKQRVVRLFGEIITLEHLEHEIIRKDFNEPRVHFALVCAALGCPPLREEPFVPERLDEQLEEQGRLFMADESKNFVDAERRVVRLSPIFDWFEEDFVMKSGTVLAFVAPYFPEDQGRWLLKGGFPIEYTHYDWSLNDRSQRKK